MPHDPKNAKHYNAKRSCIDKTNEVPPMPSWSCIDETVQVHKEQRGSKNQKDKKSKKEKKEKKHKNNQHDREQDVQQCQPKSEYAHFMEKEMRSMDEELKKMGGSLAVPGTGVGCILRHGSLATSVVEAFAGTARLSRCLARLDHGHQVETWELLHSEHEDLADKVHKFESVTMKHASN